MRRLYALVLALCAVECSATTPRATSQRVIPSADAVYRDELQRYDGGNLADALAALRPNMLRGRGRAPSLAIDGMLLMDTRPLYTTPTSDVLMVRIIRGPEATILFGSRAGGDVLMVTTRR